MYMCEGNMADGVFGILCCEVSSFTYSGNTNRGGGGGGTGRGRGRGRGRGGRGGKQRSPAPTAAELDAQLDAYKVGRRDR